MTASSVCCDSRRNDPEDVIMNCRPVACWDCGFDSCRGRGCLSVVSVVCVFATGRFLVQRSPTECGVSLRVISKPQEFDDTDVGLLRQREKMAYC